MEYKDTAIGFALARTFDHVHAKVRDTWSRPFGTDLDYERPAPPAAPVTYVRQGGNADDPRELERTVRVSDFVNVTVHLTEFSPVQSLPNCRCAVLHDDTADAMRYVMGVLTEDMAKAYGVPVERLTKGEGAAELAPPWWKHTSGAGERPRPSITDNLPKPFRADAFVRAPVHTPGQTLFHARTGHPPAVWEKSSEYVKSRWEAIAAELAEKDNKAAC